MFLLDSKTSYLDEKVNCTEPSSLSVRVPCIKCHNVEGNYAIVTFYYYAECHYA